MDKSKFNKTIEILIVSGAFLLFWLLYYAILGKIWPSNNIVKYRILSHLTQCTTFCISAFLIFPVYAVKKKKIQFIVLSILSIALFTELFNFIRFFLSNPTFQLLGSIANKKDNNILFQIFNFQYLVSALTYYLLGLGYAFARDWINKDRKSLILEKEIAQAELTLLRNQLNPHFLFNTINNIYYLALIHSTKTAEALLQLSDLLRYVLSEKENLVPLDKEYECLEKFIQLHKLRFPNDIINLNTSEIDQFNNIQVPPMILLTFVENAFKHGESNGKDEPINIHLSIKGGILKYEVHNKIGNIQSKNNNSGIGIPNLSKRLNILYPEKHKLIFDVSETHHIALLEININ